MSKTMLAVALTASAGLAACGSSGTSSSTAKPAPRPTSSTAATTPAAATAQASSAGIKFVATEYAFAPTAVTAKAGKVTMTLQNMGKIPHELILLKTDQAAGALKINSATSRVSESASVGEVSELAAGKSASHTFSLKPGKYVFVCNIPAHYKLGMHGALTVK